MVGSRVSSNPRVRRSDVRLAPAEFVDQIAACLAPDKINDESKKS
jgi:hypothetical protein